MPFLSVRQPVKYLLLFMVRYPLLSAFVAPLKVALRLLQTLSDFGRLDLVFELVHLMFSLRIPAYARLRSE